MADPEMVLLTSHDMLLNSKGCERRELLTEAVQPILEAAWLSKTTCLLRTALLIVSQPEITSPVD